MESTPLKLADGNVQSNTYYEFSPKKPITFVSKFTGWVKNIVRFFITPPKA